MDASMKQQVLKRELCLAWKVLNYCEGWKGEISLITGTGTVTTEEKASKGGQLLPLAEHQNKIFQNGGHDFNVH